jgi:hypothetical protein
MAAGSHQDSGEVFAWTMAAFYQPPADGQEITWQHGRFHIPIDRSSRSSKVTSLSCARPPSGRMNAGRLPYNALTAPPSTSSETPVM